MSSSADSRSSGWPHRAAWRRAVSTEMATSPRYPSSFADLPASSAGKARTSVGLGTPRNVLFKAVIRESPIRISEHPAPFGATVASVRAPTLRR